MHSSFLTSTRPSMFSSIDRIILSDATNIRIEDPEFDLPCIATCMTNMSSYISDICNRNDDTSADKSMSSAVFIPSSIILAQAQLTGPISCIRSSGYSGKNIDLGQSRTANMLCDSIIAKITPLQRLKTSFVLFFVSSVSIFINTFLSLVHICNIILSSISFWIKSFF